MISARSLALLLISASLAFATAEAAEEEHVIMAGGPALWQWEKLRIPKRQHDKWWANFVRASTLKIDVLRQTHGEDCKVVWIVYRPGYRTRESEDGEPYLQWISELGVKYRVELVWVDTGAEAIAALNNRPTGSIGSFNCFGHSNPHAFMLDYSNDILGSSKAWIHERDLRKIKRNIFTANPTCKSWGCHTGQSMSHSWRQTLGIRLIGSNGRTDYAPVSQQAILPTTDGRWVR